MNEMMKLMTGRRTYRRFDQSRKIPEEVIGEIIESARLSSSARNDQQLTFAVVENAEKVEEIFPMTRFAGALPKELGTPKDGEHPVLYILLLMKAEAKDPWIPVDAGIAAANMTMAAWYHGVGSCIMGAIDRKAIREALAIPESMRSIRRSHSGIRRISRRSFRSVRTESSSIIWTKTRIIMCRRRTSGIFHSGSGKRIFSSECTGSPFAVLEGRISQRKLSRNPFRMESAIYRKRVFY